MYKQINRKRNFNQNRVRSQSNCKQFNNSAASVLPWLSGNVEYYKRSTPTGDRLNHLDITTSFHDAAISFGIVTVGSGIVCFYLGWPTIVVPITFGLIVGGLRYWLGVSFARGLLLIVEEWTEDQPDDDHQQREATPIRVEVRTENRWQFADLSGDPEALQKFAKSVVGGASFSERTATKAGLTQQEFSELRDGFIDRGWAQWNHPTRRQQGVELLPSGNRVIRAIASTPLPDDNDS